MEGHKVINENALPEPSSTHVPSSPDEDQSAKAPLTTQHTNAELEVSKEFLVADKGNNVISLSEHEVDNASANGNVVDLDTLKPREEENIEAKIVARLSPEDDFGLPHVSSSHRRNASVDDIIAKIPDNYGSGQKSTERSKTSNNIDLSRGHIDTAAPIESVKAAVSKFGGIVDWKAHRVHTVERRKFIELELEKAQEEMPSYKQQSEAAEEAKTQVLKELESTKRLIEELKLNLERAQTEEQQAKQDSELAKLRVEEMEQGIADEASFAAKAQLEVAQARHAAAVSDLKTVNNELEQLKKDYSIMAAEKGVAVRKAEEAASKSKEAEKSVEDLTIEIMTLKQALESAHAAHLEAEEHRIGAVMAKEQDTLDWERELKETEEELGKLNEQMLSTKDLKSKLDKATVLLCDLKAELASYMESKLVEETGQGVDLENGPEKKTRAGIEAAVSAAKKELEEVKLNIEKANNEVNILKPAATSLKSELEKGKTDLSSIRQREGMASIAVASLEAEIKRTNTEIALVESREKEEREKMVELPEKLQDASQVVERAKALVQSARDELQKAKDETGQAKATARTMESRLVAARKEIEAAKASEKLALAAISALEECESAKKNDDEDLPNGITLTLEEYYELSKRTHEAEEEANARVADAIAQIDLAKEKELSSLNKLEQVSREMSERKDKLEAALQKAEQAKEEKLGVEMELRKWRAESEQRRKTSESPPLVVDTNRSPRPSFEEGSNNFGNMANTGSTLHQRSPRGKMVNAENTSSSGIESSPENVVMKKKKKWFSPKIFMFLGRKKAQSKKA